MKTPELAKLLAPDGETTTEAPALMPPTAAPGRAASPRPELSRSLVGSRSHSDRSDSPSVRTGAPTVCSAYPARQPIGLEMQSRDRSLRIAPEGLRIVLGG